MHRLLCQAVGVDFHPNQAESCRIHVRNGAFNGLLKRVGPTIKFHVGDSRFGNQCAVFAAGIQGIRFRLVDFPLFQHEFERESRHEKKDVMLG